MIYLLNLVILISPQQARTIADFNKESKLQGWYVVNDVVMGGRSSGNLSLSSKGHAVFSGKVSLENNGGFSSLRYAFDEIKTSKSSYIILKIKGDGKRYQFRLKHDSRSYYSYVYWFETSGKWEEISIPLAEMYPSFRGRTLDMPNFSHDSLEEIGLLIGNKKAEEFHLLIDRIELK
ncbi:MAG: CIA30 family protein [Bacteroidota bacterium]|nr:CIA30 family protein [Bacteroidota bacterium]